MTTSLAPAVAAPDRLLPLLRRSLIGLAAAGVALTAVELAMLRHWGSFVELIPWFVLALTTAMIVLAAVGRSPRTVRLIRVGSLVVAAGTCYGMAQHIIANHSSGALDARYGPKWDTMSTLAQWWAAATESVGPAPPMAPAALALGAVCLLLATLIPVSAPAWSGEPHRR